MTTQTCPECNGTGKVGGIFKKRRCSICNGQGTIERDEKLINKVQLLRTHWQGRRTCAGGLSECLKQFDLSSLLSMMVNHPAMMASALMMDCASQCQQCGQQYCSECTRQMSTCKACKGVLIKFGTMDALEAFHIKLP